MGIVKPMILLPAALASGLSPDQLQALVTHELAHIRRYDLLVNLLQRLIEALLFFHPAVWFVSRRVSIERENAADDIVLAAGWQPVQYADALVRMAEFSSALRNTRICNQATALAASGTNASDFKRRVLRLLGGDDRPTVRLTGAGLTVLVLFLTLAAFTPLLVYTWAQSRETQEEFEKRAVSADDKDIRPLDRKVSLSAIGMPLEDALVALCRAADVELALDSDGLKSARVTVEMPVTMELKDVRLEMALQQVIASLGDANINFALEDGKLLVSSLNTLNERLAQKLPEWLRPLHNRGLLARINDDQQVIEVSVGSSVANDELLAKLKTLPKLKKLYIEGGQQITDQGLKYIGEMSSLQSLSLDSIRMPDTSLAHFRHLKGLRELSLRHCQINDEAMQHVRELRNLRVLRLGTNRITDKGLVHLKALTDLQELELSDGRSPAQSQMQITDAGLIHLKAFHDLRVLNLEGTDVTSGGLRVLPNFGRLTSLFLRGGNITDEAMVHVGECRQLRRLSLQYTAVGDEGFSHVSKLGRLERLYVSSRHVTDEGIAHLSALMNLQTVVLTTSRLTDECLKHLGQVRSLQHLDLYSLGDQQFTDEGLKHLTDLKNVRRFWLASMEIGRESVDQLKQYKNLRELQFGTDSLTREEVRTLQLALPNTRVSVTRGKEWMVPLQDGGGIIKHAGWGIAEPWKPANSEDEKGDGPASDADARSSLPTRPSDVLTSYLKSSGDGDQKTRAVEMVKNAQVITVLYERDAPTKSPAKDSDFAYSLLRASDITPVSQRKGGKTYPGIQAVFSRFYGDAKDMTPHQWLEQMKRPLAVGYKLNTVTVIVTPSRGVMRESFAKSRTVMKAVARELETIKRDFAQLEEFAATHVNPGSWDEGNRPRYAHLSYKHDVGRYTKRGPEKLSADWCRLYFSIGPISGNPRQRTVPTRKYPKQGIVATWSVESGNDRLNKKFNEIVTESLTELDALEVELGKQKTKKGDSPASVAFGVRAKVPDVKGIVTAVNADNPKHIEISIGADDGLQRGDFLFVYRGRTCLSVTVIRRVAPDRAVAEVVTELKGRIQKGDEVASRLKPALDFLNTPSSPVREAKDVGAWRMQPDVKCIVNAVNADNPKHIEISIGADDDLQRGDVLFVYRNRRCLSAIVIRRVAPDRAVAEVVTQLKGQIQKGDEVTSRLKDHSAGKKRDSPASDPATGKPGSSAVENVAYIAQQVASGIEDLKDKYPNLGAFSAAKHLRKTPTHAGFAPGTPSNPELFSISYDNGVLGRKANPKDGKKRATEFIYDPKIGVHLYVHFFKGETRGNDLRVPKKIGDLSVHLSVQGPAADAIRTDIEPILDALRNEFGPNGLKGSNNPDAPDAKSEMADDLIERFSNAKYSWQQLEVARDLVASGDAKIIPKMEKYLDTKDRRRRCNAALVLAGLGDKRGLAVIINELQDKKPRPTDLTRSDGKPYPEGQIKADRYYAAWLLGHLENKEAVPALIQATKDETINYRAAISLGEIGDKSAIPALREMAKHFPDEKLWAGYGLAALGEQEGFDILTNVILSDSHWTERRHAVEALGKIGRPRAVPTVVKALKDKHVNVRVSAARALGAIRDPAALPALTKVLSDTEVTKVNAPTTVAKEAQKAIEAIKARDKRK